MGKFVYEGGPKVDIDDRALHHLQMVITAKLRRAEPFPFAWKEDSSTGGGRTTVWLHTGCAMTFKYSSAQHPHISRAWVDALAFTANSPAGLYLVPEPPEDSAHA